MSNSINFTASHREDLEKLFVKLSFEGVVLHGQFGANALTPHDMLHSTSLSTLKSLRTQLKKEISASESEEDEWSASTSEQKQLAMKKDWARYIHLVIGYLRSEAEKAKNADAVSKIDKQIAELEEANKTPEDKIKELQAKKAELSGTTAEPVAEGEEAAQA